MTGVHIADGDLLVVEEDEDQPDGAVVAALIGNGDEVTVKRLYREDELSRWEIRAGFAPSERRCLIVGRARRMRVSSVTSPSLTGTLKSTRTRTRLPLRSRSLTLFLFMPRLRW